MNLVVPTETR